MPLRPDQIADFVENTLKKFERFKWTDISLELQEYIAMSRMLTDKKVGFDGGEQLQWQVKVQNLGNAKNTGLYDTDNLAGQDLTKHAKVPWAFQTTHFIYDEREEAFQSTPERIVSLIKLRQHAAMCDLAELMEENFWGKPADDSTPAEQLKPFGLQYWVVPSGTQGFNGTNPSGFTSGAGGLSSTTYPNWANYTDEYTTVGKTDLVRKWRRAATFTKFMAPIPYPDTARGGDKLGYFTKYSVLGTLEEILEQQNDKLGNDIASKDGKVLFRSVPVHWAPYLEENFPVSDPIYGINWSVFYPVFKTGEYMKRGKPVPSPTQHRVKAVHTDNSCQFKCTDRRRLFVIRKAA